MKTCRVEGCGRDHAARGYCMAHYTRLRRGLPVESKPIKEAVYRHSLKCQIKGCGRPYLSKGYCSMHYQRKRDGMPMIVGPIRPPKPRVLPTWAHPVAPYPSYRECDCGKIAVALCTAGVGTPIMTNRKAPVELALCADCLESERYVRGEINFRELQRARLSA